MPPKLKATDEHGIAISEEFFGRIWKWIGKDVRKFMQKHPGQHIKITVSNNTSFMDFMIGEDTAETQKAFDEMVATKKAYVDEE